MAAQPVLRPPPPQRLFPAHVGGAQGVRRCRSRRSRLSPPAPHPTRIPDDDRPRRRAARPRSRRAGRPAARPMDLRLVPPRGAVHERARAERRTAPPAGSAAECAGSGRGGAARAPVARRREYRYRSSRGQYGHETQPRPVESSAGTGDGGRRSQGPLADSPFHRLAGLHVPDRRPHAAREGGTGRCAGPDSRPGTA